MASFGFIKRKGGLTTDEHRCTRMPSTCQQASSHPGGERIAQPQIRVYLCASVVDHFFVLPSVQYLGS